MIAEDSEAASVLDYPVRPATGYPLSTTQPGITLAAHPVSGSREQATYFGVNFKKKGFLPIFIVATNASSDSVFLRKDAISCYVTGEGASPTATPEVHSKAGPGMVVADAAAGAIAAVGGAVAGVGGAGNPLPLGSIGLNLVSKSADV